MLLKSVELEILSGARLDWRLIVHQPLIALEYGKLDTAAMSGCDHLQREQSGNFGTLPYLAR